MKEGTKHQGIVFMPDNESAEPLDPREGPLDDPAVLVTPEGPSVLRLGFLSRGAVGHNQPDATAGQVAAQRVTVVRPVGD